MCGKTGCLETVVSGLALESFFHQSTGKTMDYKEILSSTSWDDFPLSENWLGPPTNGGGDTKDVIINS